MQIFRTPIFKFNPVVRKFMEGLAAQGLFYAIIAVYYASYLVLHLQRPDLATLDVWGKLGQGIWLSLPVVAFSIAALRMYHVIRFEKPDYPIAAILKEWVTFLAHPQRLANGLPIIVATIFFTILFADIQGKTLWLNPNVWDRTFADLDRIIHFGRQPWQWLQPVVGFPYVSFLINLNYSVWYFVVWLFITYFAFARHTSVLRTQFFLSFLLTWIVGGSVLAVIFSSAGPCYFDRLGFLPNPYSELMSYLRVTNTSVPIWAIDVQDLLWKGYLAHAELSEVSAMPSMHNASTLLMVLASFRLSKFWGWVLVVHSVLVFVGSVCLGWHYAVDSYVAWALVLAIWFAMAPVARWWQGICDARQQS